MGEIKLNETQLATIKFLATKPGLLPSGRETPKVVRDLIEMNFAKEGGKIVGLEGESKSEFYLTPAGEAWLEAYKVSMTKGVV
jgi:hypothetical protein